MKMCRANKGLGIDLLIVWAVWKEEEMTFDLLTQCKHNRASDFWGIFDLRGLKVAHVPCLQDGAWIISGKQSHLVFVDGSDAADSQRDRLLLAGDDDLVLRQAGRWDADAGPCLKAQLLHQPVVGSGDEGVEGFLQGQTLHRALVLVSGWGRAGERRQTEESIKRDVMVMVQHDSILNSKKQFSS